METSAELREGTQQESGRADCRGAARCWLPEIGRGLQQAGAEPGLCSRARAGLLQKKAQDGAQTTMEATLMAQQTPQQREQVCTPHLIPCLLMP